MMLDATHAFPADTADADPPPSAAPQQAAAPAADEKPVPLPLRHDTLLGVCEAIGEDFRVNPNLLRVALALGLFVSPLGTIALYLGLGIVVAASRWFFPTTRRSATVAPRQAEASAEQPALPLAA